MKRLVIVGCCLAGMFLLFRGTSCAGPSSVTLATFNIRMFPEKATDPERVAQRLSEIDADIIAVQEIRDEDSLLDVLQKASQRSGRTFRLTLSSCGGPANLSTGIVYDAKRLSLVGTRQYREHRSDETGSCSRGYRPAFLAVFADQTGKRFAALSVHMQHGPRPEQLAARKKQWKGVVQILNDVQKEYNATAFALGDFNSTGFSDDAGGEKTFIDKILKEANLQLATEEVPCTAYWRPNGKGGDLVPSILDHVVVGRGDFEIPEPLGMCAALSCEKSPANQTPKDYESVSDHCPIRIRAK